MISSGVRAQGAPRLTISSDAKPRSLEPSTQALTVVRDSTTISCQQMLSPAELRLCSACGTLLQKSSALL